MKNSFTKSIITKTILVTAICTCLLACEKDITNESNQQIVPTSTTIWLLNEGSWGGNNADISLIDYETGDISNYIFSEKNGRGLGDTGQDIIAYGSHLYISVWGSNTIEVVDPADGKSVRQISLGSRGPRYLLAYNGKVYVSCYNKTIVRIDTASLSLDPQECPLSGMQPENICRVGNRLYVCNSWEYQNGVYTSDSTLSVVDLDSFSEIKKITVGISPSTIQPINDHSLLIISQNASMQSVLKIIDLESETVTETDIMATGFDIYQNTCYSYYQNWTTGETSLQKTNLSTLETTPIDISSAGLTSPYGIKVIPANGNILITDALDYSSNGDVACITREGRLLWKCEASVGPSRIVIMN